MTVINYVMVDPPIYNCKHCKKDYSYFYFIDEKQVIDMCVTCWKEQDGKNN